MLGGRIGVDDPWLVDSSSRLRCQFKTRARPQRPARPCPLYRAILRMVNSLQARMITSRGPDQFYPGTRCLSTILRYLPCCRSNTIALLRRNSAGTFWRVGTVEIWCVYLDGYVCCKAMQAVSCWPSHNIPDRSFLHTRDIVDDPSDVFALV